MIFQGHDGMSNRKSGHVQIMLHSCLNYSLHVCVCVHVRGNAKRDCQCLGITNFTRHTLCSRSWPSDFSVHGGMSCAEAATPSKPGSSEKYLQIWFCFYITLLHPEFLNCNKSTTQYTTWTTQKNSQFNSDTAYPVRLDRPGGSQEALEALEESRPAAGECWRFSKPCPSDKKYKNTDLILHDVQLLSLEQRPLNRSQSLNCFYPKLSQCEHYNIALPLALVYSFFSTKHKRQNLPKTIWPPHKWDHSNAQACRGSRSLRVQLAAECHHLNFLISHISGDLLKRFITSRWWKN